MGNCSLATMRRVEAGVMDCLDSETLNHIQALIRIPSGSNFNEEFCRVFNSTFGNCLRLPWTEPDCFSPREAEFLRENFHRRYTESLQWAEEISAGYRTLHPLSDCIRGAGTAASRIHGLVI